MVLLDHQRSPFVSYLTKYSSTSTSFLIFSLALLLCAIATSSVLLTPDTASASSPPRLRQHWRRGRRQNGQHGQHRVRPHRARRGRRRGWRRRGRRARGGGGLVLPRAPPREVPPLHELCVVDHPEGAKVVLVADEALVQRQVRADRVLYMGDSGMVVEVGGGGCV